MCVVRLEKFASAIRTGAIDVIHGDVHKWPGSSPYAGSPRCLTDSASA
jgi:glucarate dehydratase